MSTKKTCRNCGKEFDPDNPSDHCRYHPEEAVHVGTADSRYDYSEVYRYPCCGLLDFPEALSYQSPPGCVEGVHVAGD
jgi:hypothetical protein